METRKTFEVEFSNHPPFKVFINEEVVVEALYNKSSLYETAGTVAMTAFDIALAMGGCWSKTHYSISIRWSIKGICLKRHSYL